MQPSPPIQSFYHWMQHALYHPESGYYRRVQQRVGREGDFVTSVSSGKLLGKLLAHKLRSCWIEAGRHANFHWIEQGGETGQLTADVLEEVLQRFPELVPSLQVTLIEPWAENRKTQHETLQKTLSSCSAEALLERTHWVETPQHLPPCQALFFANELLDAFPAQVFECKHSGWQELGVAEIIQPDLPQPQAQWASLHQLPGLPPALDEDLPAPWQWEHQPDLIPWLETLSEKLQLGSTLLLLDYGLTQAELREPSRRHGSLRGYRNHRQVKPLDHPAGEADLTVHVHWDDLRQAAPTLGWQEQTFAEQGRYLTQLAKPLLLELEARALAKASPPDPQLLRQFHSLLHPAHLGAKFQALEIAKLPKSD